MVSLRHFTYDVIILSCHDRHSQAPVPKANEECWMERKTTREGEGGSCVKTLDGYFHAVLEVFSNSATFSTTARDVIGNLSASTP